MILYQKLLEDLHRSKQVQKPDSGSKVVLEQRSLQYQENKRFYVDYYAEMQVVRSAALDNTRSLAANGQAVAADEIRHFHSLLHLSQMKTPLTTIR